MRIIVRLRRPRVSPTVIDHKAALFWFAVAVAVFASRLCHAHILWADEDYHLAAAIQVLLGKLPYRDFWYDKPPLNLAFYLLFGARTGVVLRLADSAYVMLCCALAYRFAGKLWSQREGFLAAGAIAFFSIFYLAPGVIPEDPDMLMLAPHLAAMYLAFRGRPLWAGVAAAVAFQLNVKGAIVLASAALFTPASFSVAASLGPLLLGFLLPNAVALALLAGTHSLGPYVEQVWRWGLLDAGSTQYGFGLATLLGLWTALGWIGFHAALIIGAAFYWIRQRGPESIKLLAWSFLSLAAVSIGWRFAPRYFVQLLPAVAIPAARGFWLSPRSLRLLMAAALLAPAIRFGPRYVQLARGVPWADTAMDRESEAAALLIRDQRRPGDTIFVWGYRPGVVAYTRLAVGARIWDSQPLTGVPANRHLSDDVSADPAWAGRNRAAFLASRPTFVVDGLTLYNPRLDIHKYPELAQWMTQYCPMGQAGLTLVYRLCR